MRNLTRQQLYELLWTKPTTEIAKELGVSDVWVGKVCKRANIPKPPPGYWQKIAAGKVIKRLPLPPPRPLQAINMYVLGDTSRSRYYRTFDWPQPKTDDEPIPPPPDPPFFSEPMEQVRARAEALMAPLKLNETLTRPHAMTFRLLSGDERRAAKNWSWQKPRFSHASGKEVLTALNRLFWAWESLGAEVRVDGQTNQSITIDVLGELIRLTILDYRWDGNSLDPRFKPGAKYGLHWEYVHDTHRLSPKTLKTYREYDNLQAETLRALLVESVVIAETDIRRHEQSRYEWIIRQRDEVIRKREERRLATIRRHEEEVQRLIQKRIDLTEVAISRIANAERLRSLIDAFDQKISASGHPVTGYEKWRRWAIQQANEIDPRSMSVEHIEQWISHFDLHE